MGERVMTTCIQSTGHPRLLKERLHLTGFEIREQVADKFIVNMSVLSEAQTLLDPFPTQEMAPLLPDELPIGDSHRPAFRGRHLEEPGDHRMRAAGQLPSLVWDDGSDQRDHGAQDEEVEWGLTILPVEKVYDQGELG